jgi:hypothetical protein
MKNIFVLSGLCFFFFGCTQDECECELPEDDFYFKFEVNGTQHLYEDEFNVAHNIFEEEYAIWSLHCKAFLDAESGTGSRISLSLYNNEPIQVRKEYALQDLYQDGPEFRPRVRIRYTEANGEQWEANQSLVQIENYDFEKGVVKCLFNATLVNIYFGNKTLKIQNGEFRLPLVFAM